MVSERPGLLERWSDLREKLLSSERFQRWAAAFPLTRLIARRRAGELFDLCAGFVYSQTLLACVQLQLFERLRRQPLAVDVLAAAIDLPVAATVCLVDAAIALRLL